MDVDRIKNTCTETLVLSLLLERPMHGYEMCKEVERRSQSYFRLKHSTLYPLLHKLDKAGLVTSKWGEFAGGKPRKYYRLTKKGHTYHRANVESWQQLFASIRQLVPEFAG